MTFGSAALRARKDGTLEYFPAVPTSLLQPLAKAEVAVQRSRPKLVGHDDSMVVARSHVEKSHVEDSLSDITEARNLRSAPVHKFSNDDLAQVVSGVLKGAFADKKSGIKTIQKVANSNYRTAKNWWEGRNAPDGLNLLKLMAEVPELQAEVRRLTAMATDLDPHLDHAMGEVMRLYLQARKGNQ
jgi:hypothetical protein